MRSFRPVGPGALAATGVAVAVASVAGVEQLPAALRYGPLLASAVLLGLPHGAVDHLLTSDLLANRPGSGESDGETSGLAGIVALAMGGATAAGVRAVVAVYAVLGGAYGLVWLAAPVAAAVLFVLVTWFHWGQGDLYHLLASAEESHLTTPGLRALTLVVRGGLPMLVPLLAFPDVYRRILEALAAVVSPGATVPTWPFAARSRLALGVGFAAITLAALLWGRIRATSPSRRRAWRFDAGETLLLWTFFLVVPPVLAIGVYFTLWHAVRHVRRVLALGGGEPTPTVAGAVAALDRAAIRRFVRVAALNTAGALVLLAGIYAAGAGAGLLGLAADYLVTIAVLTLPHTAVVTWLDRRQGVWTDAPTG